MAIPPQHAPQLVVHFPPSPSLTTHTFSVDSASAYDRSPIIVAPNSCALPERGCPGRTYTLDDDPATSRTPTRRDHYYASGDLRHPRAFYGASRTTPKCLEPGTYSLPPPLIPDLSSSESEENDDVASPPLGSPHITIPSHLHGLAIPEKYFTHPFDGTPPKALSFLPHPSSPSRSAYTSRLSVPGEPHNQSPRRHRERKYEGSYDLGRISSGPVDMQQYTVPKTTRKSKVSGFSKSLPACHAASSFRVEDDGCLGGF